VLIEPAMTDAASQAAPAPDTIFLVPGLVWAFRLHSDGVAESLLIDTPVEFTHDGRLWLHFSLTDARARSWLAAADIPASARDLLVSHDNYQQLHTVDGCIYGVFSDLVRDIDEVTEETGFLRFAMTERLLISDGTRRCAPSTRHGAYWKAAIASTVLQRCSKRSSMRSPIPWTAWPTRSEANSTPSRSGFSLAR
jgi:hypothetical protein